MSRRQAGAGQQARSERLRGLPPNCATGAEFRISLRTPEKNSLDCLLSDPVG
ncbi:hypothetical protein Ga0080559_TMP3660 [Salipiger profundus]|uniref:Uncharacterized protein n=1 Tax=Salipiger profundus TaxID=1229727 RepID=A0A1U7D8R7_9RHOB|nr:hypothetical protein Ga0080559_TMP3660 [Salipiger profundus]